MADYTATTDMTLETAIANGPMGNGDNLTIDNGAVVTCDQTPSILMGQVIVNNGEILIDGASATNPIIFAMDNGYSDRVELQPAGKFTVTEGWYSIGTTDGTDSQVISNLDGYFGNTRVCGFSGIWIETGRRIDFDNAAGTMPEVNDYVNKAGDKDLFGLITEVGADYLIVRYLLGTLADNDDIEVWKVIDNQGPQYKKSWTATVNNASGDIKAPGVYQGFANVYTNGTSYINDFGHKSSGFVFEMQFRASTLTLGSSTGGGFVPPAGCDIRVPMVTFTSITATDYDNGMASFGTNKNYFGYMSAKPGSRIQISGLNTYWTNLFWRSGTVIGIVDSYIKHISSFAAICIAQPKNNFVLQDFILCDNPVNNAGETYPVSIVRSSKPVSIIDGLIVLAYCRAPLTSFFRNDSVSNCTVTNLIEVISDNGSDPYGSMDAWENVIVTNLITHGKYTRFDIGSATKHFVAKNIKMSFSINGDPAATYNNSAIIVGSGSEDIQIENIENLEGGKLGSQLFFQHSATRNIRIRAIGTPNSPYIGDYAGPFARVEPQDFSIARVYVSGFGSSYGFSWAYYNDYRHYNHDLINCGTMDYNRQYIGYGEEASPTEDRIIHGIYCQGPANNIYIGRNCPGLFFGDIFYSATDGMIILWANVATDKMAPFYSIVAGSPYQKNGRIDFQAGDSCIFEMNYSALGHISFTGDYTTAAGTGVSNHADEAGALTIEFQYDTGGGWNGSWLDIRTASNLTSIPDFRTGIKLKMRLTATANVSGFSGVFLDTTTSDTARADNLYPIDQAWVPVKITALDVYDSTPIQDAMVLLETDTGGPAPAGEDIIKALTGADGSIINDQYLFSGDQPVTGRIRKASTPPYYKTAKISGTITESGLDLKIFMIRD